MILLIIILFIWSVSSILITSQSLKYVISVPSLLEILILGELPFIGSFKSYKLRLEILSKKIEERQKNRNQNK